MTAPLALPSSVTGIQKDRPTPATNALLPDTARALYPLTGVAIAGHLLGAMVVVGLYAGAAPLMVLGSWCGFFALVWFYRLAMLRRYIGCAGADLRRDAHRWLWRWNLGALACGAAWGAAVWLLYHHGRPHQQAALLVIAFSSCVSSIPLLAPQFRVFLGFISLVLVPTVARLASMGDPDQLLLAGVVSLSYLMTSMLGRAYRNTFEGVVDLTRRTEHLATQMQDQKTSAEAAQLKAEAADRAKTQFLATASHDLRQPLHAMGLLADALRARSRGDEELTRLVDNLNGSVEALERLFGELLDITKIDAGRVEAHPARFTLGELFERLRLQHEPAAFDKGLALRLRGAHLSVRADPVLVDQILRNLLGNAIRYTEDGAVLLSARRRAGHVDVQVWDTGRGIAPEEQTRVFEEFYQVPAHGAVSERAGLGLGLSIAQRLARVMDTPLTLRSVPSRGTVFTLSLPLGDPPEQTVSHHAPTQHPLTFTRRRIVIVEPDAAVRESQAQWLRGWGAVVDAFDTTTALETWFDDAPPRPDLVIVADRFPDALDGCVVLDAIDRAFVVPTPAILLTSRKREAQATPSLRQGVHPLPKPVPPHKLRAMVAFKLDRR